MHVAEGANLGEAHWHDREPALAWFVAVVAPPQFAERISRAIATELEGLKPLDRALDVHIFHPGAEPLGWIVDHGLPPIYDRAKPPSVRTTEGGRA